MKEADIKLRSNVILADGRILRVLSKHSDQAYGTVIGGDTGGRYGTYISYDKIVRHQPDQT